MFYNVSQDYSISQHNATTELLYKYSIEWVGPPPIPKGVLSSAASSYNSIQSNVRAARVNSDATESKNFVHRASIMNQILASLIFHESRAAGNAIPRAIIAKFMQLESSGFAKGDDIVRNAVSRGYIDLALDIDDTGSYVGRYLEALELEEDPSNSAFIEEIVAAADAEFIGSSSHLSSKIVGALLLGNRAWDLYQQGREGTQVTLAGMMAVTSIYVFVTMMLIRPKKEAAPSTMEREEQANAIGQ